MRTNSLGVSLIVRYTSIATMSRAAVLGGVDSVAGKASMKLSARHPRGARSIRM